MEPAILLAGAGLLLAALLLSKGVEGIIRRFDAHPAEPEERSGGFRDVAEHLERWRRSRDSS